MNYSYLYENSQEECSSGCESGWTVYLDHSSMSAHDHHQENGYDLDGKSKRMKYEDVDKDEDEDLSMVSDASSGPPHLHEEESYTKGCYFPIDDAPNSSGNNKMKIENRRWLKGQDQTTNLLDDTASSPFLGFSINKTRSQPTVVKNVMEYSQGYCYSTTQYGAVRQPYQEHSDFFHTENQMQQDHRWFEGKGW